MTPEDSLSRVGWCRFDAEEAVVNWVRAALPVARDLAQDPQHIADWLRCGGTWFAGVNILPNDAQTALPGGPRLDGSAMRLLLDLYGPQSWDRAQLSVIYPGYPQPMEGESPAAFKFRRHRDAAHVDGLLPVGPYKRRHLHEQHGFVLGVPLTACAPGASPMVVWEGSHLMMQDAFQQTLKDAAPQDWHKIDLTEIYQRTRRACFETCRRVTVSAQPGEAYIIHRLALHGVAPWQTGATAPPEGRMIAYFRPELTNPADWLA